jgi:hypothetical protein
MAGFKLKWILLIGAIVYCFALRAQQTGQEVDFDAVDSLIATTPELDMCLKNGEEDLRFFSKTPEKYSDFKQRFMDEALRVITAIPAHNHFRCEITVEVDCKGRAGNYNFGIEPRTFSVDDYKVLEQLIKTIDGLRNTTFTPAYYLGESVNSKVRFVLLVKDDKLIMQ